MYQELSRLVTVQKSSRLRREWVTKVNFNWTNQKLREAFDIGWSRSPQIIVENLRESANSRVLMVLYSEFGTENFF